MKIKSILVFCGSKTGNNPLYETTTCQLGKILAEKGITIIYGAGNVGLMGVLADATLAAGGKVEGIIPYFLSNREGGRTDLTELVQVDSMAERKKLMAKRADAVITLPGGYGTLDELFEMLTLVQLSKAAHPIGILNINGFFNPLIAQLDLMEQEGFLRSEHRNLLIVSEDIEELILKMEESLP